MNKLPPKGVTPELRHLKTRFADLVEASLRYQGEDIELPKNWRNEKEFILRRIQELEGGSINIQVERIRPTGFITKTNP